MDANDYVYDSLTDEWKATGDTIAHLNDRLTQLAIQPGDHQ